MTKVDFRQNQIVERVRERGFVTVEGLAVEFHVSPQTIRRDINALCNLNVLRRRHGGAELLEATVNLDYGTREVQNARAKEAIARRAAALIPHGATVFISIGTTPAKVSEALRGRRNLIVITNNLNAAFALSGEPSNRIIIPGGELRLPDRDILGDNAEALFGRYRADFGIYGVAGVDTDGSLLDFHYAEVRSREAIRRNCRSAILVADRSKFGRAAPAIGGNLLDADRVIIDALPAAAFRALMDRAGEALEVTGTESS